MLVSQLLVARLNLLYLQLGNQEMTTKNKYKLSSLLKRTTLLFLLTSSSFYVSAFEVIQGNSDEYIMTMEKLNQVNHLLKSANELLVEVHTKGYQLPNSNIKKILSGLSEQRESLLILLRPEINRTRTHVMTPSGDFVTNELETIIKNEKVRK